MTPTVARSMVDQGVHQCDGAIWTSPEMAGMRSTIDRIAMTTLPVLITGESGTGKEVIARAIHSASQRRDRRMVVVDCAAIAPTLLESELFGHKKGAFTGAATTTLGLVRAADGGTFFLDEIGELPTTVQAKLLRLLQDGSYRPVGESRTDRADLRIISATNRDIEAEIVADRFRSDLYHRLNGVRLHIPPLRDRRADILPLMQHYMHLSATTHGKEQLVLSPEVEHLLVNAPWPGNVRELVNCAHYVGSLASGPQVNVDDLPPSFQNPLVQSASELLAGDSGAMPLSAIRTDLPYKEAKRAWLDIFEAQYVRDILSEAEGNVSKAARDSGMDRRSVQRILKRLEDKSG